MNYDITENERRSIELFASQFHEDYDLVGDDFAFTFEQYLVLMSNEEISLFLSVVRKLINCTESDDEFRAELIALGARNLPRGEDIRSAAISALKKFTLL